MYLQQAAYRTLTDAADVPGMRSRNRGVYAAQLVTRALYLLRRLARRSTFLGHRENVDR